MLPSAAAADAEKNIKLGVIGLADPMLLLSVNGITRCCAIFAF